MITQEVLKEIFCYYPDTGLFVRRSGRYAGVAGSNTSRYVDVSIGNRMFQAHRLAWLYVYGSFPKGAIDHINGDKRDNRLFNLREATRSENGCNRGKGKANSSGFKGVDLWCGKWRARIKKHGKSVFLGYFEIAEKAHEAYCDAAKEIHGNFHNGG